MRQVQQVEMVALGVVAVIAGAGCGYALAGRGNVLPAHIRVVGVPPFENATTYPNLENVVTENVQAEFQSRGRFRVLPEAATADAVLIGRIVGLDLAPVSISNELQASRYVVTMVASVEFLDQTRNNEVIWSNPAMTFRDEYDLPSDVSADDPTAFFRQDANALERLAKNFARTTVTSILEAF